MAAEPSTLTPQLRRVLAEWPLLLGFAVLAVPALVTLAGDNWSTEAGSDGPIILATGAWLLWSTWPQFLAEGVAGQGGVTAAILAPSLASYVLGRAYDFETLAMLGVWGTGVAMLQSRFGAGMLRRTWFPFLYLAFLIPPPEFILHALTAPLKIFVSWAATSALALAGLPVVSHGVAIDVGSYQLLVEEACSGMNSILGLLAVGLFYIHLMHVGAARRSLILAATLVPIAVLANIVRIMVLILLTYFAGNDAAQGFLHGFAGLVVFSIALLLVFGVDQVASRLDPRRESPPVTRRRNLIMGGACVAAGAASFGLTPRRRVSLLGTDKLDAIVPRNFGDWTSTDMDDEVAPKEAGSLASRLYGQTVGRLYANRLTGAEVMMLLAYGDTQSNDLQVHRPEVCYPAFGYEILSSALTEIAVSGTVAIPARRLVAQKAGRAQEIVYWTRMGEALPLSVSEQRVERWRNAVRGQIVDGLLVRFSRLLPSDEGGSPIGPLAGQLVLATVGSKRRVFVGSDVARRLAGARPAAPMSRDPATGA